MKGYYMVLSEDRDRPWQTVDMMHVEKIFDAEWERVENFTKVKCIEFPNRRYYIVQIREKLQATGPVEVEHYDL